MENIAIYRDALGNFEPRATVSYIHDVVSGKDRFSLHAASDLPDREWPADAPVEQIVADLEAAGFECSVSRDGFNHPQIDAIHRETAAAREESARPIREARERGVECFVRFGRLPESGHSRNYVDGTPESGVSVFRARRHKGLAVIMCSTNQQIGSLLGITSRSLYLVSGEAAGIGSDGEPLLSNCTARRIRDKVAFAH
jgi:hypothetical protein